MRTSRTTLLATALSATLAGTLCTSAAVAGTTSAAAAGGQCSAQLVSLPAPPGTEALLGLPESGGSDAASVPSAALTGVSVLSGKNAMFTGYSDGPIAPWTLRWDGNSATEITSPSAGTLGFSAAGHAAVGIDASVSFDSGADGWMIGRLSSPNELVQAGEHWNGTSWSLASVAVAPDPAANAVLLYDVAAIAPANAWAAGGFFDTHFLLGSHPNGALIEHWDGSQWTIVPNPASSRPGTMLAAISATSAHDVWAVGMQGLAGTTGHVPFAEHYDGKTWTVLPDPPLGTGSQFGRLSSVSATADGGLWAGGYQMATAESEPVSLAEHWDGSTWTVARLPSLPQAGSVNDAQSIDGIYAASSSDVWAVPATTDVNSPGFLHWDGSRWGRVPMPGPQAYGLKYIYGAISGSGPGNVLAAGEVYSGETQTSLPQLARLSCGAKEGQ